MRYGCWVLALIGCGSSSAGDRLCGALANAINKCGAASDCDKAMVKDCSSLVGLLNEAYVGAAADCIEKGTDPRTCLQNSLSTIMPTQADKDFAAAFCKNCALGVPNCESAFFAGSAAGAGAVLLPLSDKLVGKLQGDCTKGLTCGPMFPTCAEMTLLQSAIPKQTLECLLSTLTSRSGGSCGSASDAGPLDDMSANPGDMTTPPPDLMPGPDMATNANCVGSNICDTNLPAFACGAYCPGTTCSCGGVTTCNADYTCTCPPDQSEPNETFDQATSLGSYNINPISSNTYPDLGIHNSRDNDWYTYKINDNPTFSSPWTQIYFKQDTVNSPQADLNQYEVSVYYQCNGGGSPPACNAGTAVNDPTLGQGCRYQGTVDNSGNATVDLQTNCNGLDKGGTVYVNVHATRWMGRCQNYSLTLRNG